MSACDPQLLFQSHIGEHVGVPVDLANMTAQELQFHYFKMHDADVNNKLDGCELVKSMIHWHSKFFLLMYRALQTWDC